MLFSKKQGCENEDYWNFGKHGTGTIFALVYTMYLAIFLKLDLKYRVKISSGNFDLARLNLRVPFDILQTHT